MSSEGEKVSLYNQWTKFKGYKHHIYTSEDLWKHDNSILKKALQEKKKVPYSACGELMVKSMQNPGMEVTPFVYQMKKYPET